MLYNDFLSFFIGSITIKNIFVLLFKGIEEKNTFEQILNPDPEGKAIWIRIHSTDGIDLDPILDLPVPGIGI